MNTPVVILNMHYSGLAIARDLWQPGRRIIGLSSNREFFGNASKYHEFRLCPDTESDPARCAEFLGALAGELAGKPLLLPTRDHDVHFIIRYREQLARDYLLAYPDSAVLAAILDKSELARAAAAVDVHSPVSIEVACSADLEKLHGNISFPCIVKPVIASHWRRGEIRNIVQRQKALRIESFAELQEIYQAIEAHDPRVTVQEYIPGPESNLVIFGSYCNRESRVTASFTARKRLQYPATAGTGVVVEARPVPAIVAMSERLLQAVGYVGMSEIEYKYDALRDRYVLIEINTRHWDQHGLGTAVGVNLSEVLYPDMLGGRPPTCQQSVTPVCWLAEDGFLLSLIGNVKHRAYPWREYWDILRTKKSLAVFRWGDAKPALFLLRTIVADFFQRCARFAKRLLPGRG